MQMLLKNWRGKNIFPFIPWVENDTLSFSADLKFIWGFLSIFLMIITTMELYRHYSGYSCVFCLFLFFMMWCSYDFILNRPNGSFIWQFAVENCIFMDLNLKFLLLSKVVWVCKDFLKTYLSIFIICENQND